MGLVLCVGMVGCGQTGGTHEEEKTDSYSHVWAAQDTEVKHDTGATAVDDGWGAVARVHEVGALCSVEVPTLRAPAYTAAARLLVSDQRRTSKNVAAVLRVLNSEGEELGKEIVRVCDFKANLTYQDFVFTFAVEEATPATFEIYWPGTDYVRVSEFGIMSKKAETLPDFNQTGDALLDVNNEESITYDEDALYYFDLYEYMTEKTAHAEDQYDIANLVTTLQGLVNRDGQHLFVRFRQPDSRFPKDTDKEWLDFLTDDGQWLEGKEVVTVKSPMTLLKLFDEYYTGFAAWDPAVPATVNGAATACGVEGLLPVRYSTVRNSLYWYVKNNAAFANKPVKVDLGGKFTGEGTVYGTDVASTGSRKNDVYLWAKAQYLDTHKTASHLMAYHVDAYASNTVFAAYADLQNMYLSNRDYYIANKAFFFDLSPLISEVPDDDPDQAKIFGGVTQLTTDISIDYNTLTAIMTAQAQYAASKDATLPIDVGGFTPWTLKYTRFTNPEAAGEVDVEWATVRVFSMYNAFVNADAPGYTGMANASIYQNYPMSEEGYHQKGAKTVKEELPSASEQGVNYLLFYMGDFDASAWLNTTMPSIWNDGHRGDIPLCWPFSLDISKRAGHVIDWMYKTATENDYFVAGDNGVGYLNPESYATATGQSMYGDLDSWAAYNKTRYEYFDIDYTGFLIFTSQSGATKEIMECYAKFCSGLASNYSYQGEHVAGLETVRSIDGNHLNASAIVKSFGKMQVGSLSTFTQIRFILNSPTDVMVLYNTLKSDAYKEYNFKVVDPYTFYGLLARQNGHV